MLSFFSIFFKKHDSSWVWSVPLLWLSKCVYLCLVVFRVRKKGTRPYEDTKMHLLDSVRCSHIARKGFTLTRYWRIGIHLIDYFLTPFSVSVQYLWNRNYWRNINRERFKDKKGAIGKHELKYYKEVYRSMNVLILISSILPNRSSFLGRLGLRWRCH